MIIAVDFDGTCVAHHYPSVGPDVPHVVKWLKTFVANNKIRIILWTMRSGKSLEDAVKWFERNNISLYGVNANPSQTEWTTSPKAYANLYIDDAAFGCPLIVTPEKDLVVDWKTVGPAVLDLYNRKYAV